MYFVMEDIQMANKQMKIFSSLLVIKKMQIKPQYNTTKYPQA